jgi:hypothetical protein
LACLAIIFKSFFSFNKSRINDKYILADLALSASASASSSASSPASAS